jgi:uncharacterized protein YhaN
MHIRENEVDITRRLRQTRADMLGTPDEDHYWDCHEAAGEIERLRQWGRLTDAEREAVERACCALGGVIDMSAECSEWDAEARQTLLSLLERMGGER